MSKDDDSFRAELEEVGAGESELVHDLGKGALAGLIATIPVALLAVIKQVLGFIPQIDLIAILGGLTGLEWAGTGWVLLFVVGVVLGIAFASLDAHVEDATEAGEMVRGALFGFLLWVALMLMFIPLYSNSGFGVVFAGSVLVTNLIFGMVMGVAYERMKPEHLD